MIDTLPTRLDDTQLAWVRSISLATLPPLEPADDGFFNKCMRTLQVLPARPDDDVRGELRLGLYQRHFGGYCRDALSYLVKEATIRCRFLPSPVECKAILDEWVRGDTASVAKAKARSRARIEMEARFDEIMTALAARSLTQAQIDALPEKMRMIGVERGYLRLSEGEFTIRHEGDRVAPVATPSSAASESRCKCQGIGRVLNLEGEEVDCKCRLVAAQA